MIGYTIGQYKILAKLGQGATGVVYKAEDTSLRRNVAVKFLKPEDWAIEENRTRLMREAQAAATLDNPNICHIYGIHEDNGETFIAMAYIDGPTLAEKIQQRPVPLDEALDLAIQLAEGLEEAHEKGIVHRDIKPSNVMLTAKGRLKIMDFGLASLAGRTKITKSGTTVGTPAYMAPEQVQAEKVDRRADIWALGCVLYEMLTQRSPFEADYEQAVLYAILNEPHKPVTELRSGLPTQIDRILDKALAKNPDERYQDAADLLVDLRQQRNLPPSSASIRASRTRGSDRPGRSWPVLAGLALVVAFAAGWFLRSLDDSDGTASTASRPTPLTTYPGAEAFPTFSPEGDRVAFVWDGEGQDNSDVYVKLIGENTPQRLTVHPARDMSPAWSPDGRWIAFLRVEEQAATLMLVPAIGGPERPVLEGVVTTATGVWGSAGRYLAWHPDGEHIVASFVDGPTEPASLSLVSVETGDVRPLTEPEGAIVGDIDPAVSPDGRRLVFRRKYGNWAVALFVQDLTESLEPAGSPRRLTRSLYAFSPVWSLDSRNIIFAAESPERPRLWQVSAEGGPARPIDDRIEGGYPALSPAGNRAAYVVVSVDQDIYATDRSGKVASRPLVSSTFVDLTPMLSPDGARIAFSSSRSGYRELWVCGSDGSNPVQLTHLRSVISDAPFWSPDGTRIAFQTVVDDQREIFTVRSTGGQIERLTDDPSQDFQPSWSRDGKWVYFGSDRSGEARVWKVPAGGGDPVPVTDGPADYAVESHDGLDLYVVSGRELWSRRAGSDALSPVLEDLWNGMAFSPAVGGLYYIRREPPGVYFYDSRSKQSEPLFQQARRFGYGLSASADGGSVIWPEGRPMEADIMLVDGFR